MHKYHLKSWNSACVTDGYAYPAPLATAVTAIAIQEGSAVNSDVPKIEIRMNAAGNLPTWQFPVSVYVDGMYLDLAPETGSGAFKEFTSKNTDWNFKILWI